MEKEYCAAPIQFGKQRFELCRVQGSASDRAAKIDADHAEIIKSARQFNEGGIDVRQRQGGERGKLTAVASADFGVEIIA